MKGQITQHVSKFAINNAMVNEATIKKQMLIKLIENNPIEESLNFNIVDPEYPEYRKIIAENKIQDQDLIKELNNLLKKDCVKYCIDIDIK